MSECLDLAASRKPKKGASYQEEEQVIPNASAMGTPGCRGNWDKPLDWRRGCRRQMAVVGGEGGRGDSGAPIELSWKLC